MITINSKKRTVNSVSKFLTKGRIEKIGGLAPSKKFEEIGVDLFNFYVNCFGYEGESYDDAVEVEAIKLAEETELFIKSQCEKIEKIVADKTSKVCVYSELLYQVYNGVITPDRFLKAKERLCIYS